MFFNKFAICSIPYINLSLIVDRPALALNSSGLFTYFHFIEIAPMPFLCNGYI